MRPRRIRLALIETLDELIAEAEASDRLAEQAIEDRRNRRQALRDQRRIAETRARCQSLIGFIREGWHVLEPGTPFVEGWAIQAICEHLEAITNGHITRLQINCPPGLMKSLTTGVFWPAWEWGPKALAYLRYFTTSWNGEWATRDSRKMRDLILSDWYQAHWPMALTRAGEDDFENAERGNRKAMPFQSLTSGRGNRVVIDDPLSTEQSESQADRERAVRIFRESVPFRLNDQRKDAIAIIMHRLHPRDPCGIIDELGLPYTKLILPMEFEPKRRCHTIIGWEDPRKRDGDLLFPERFPKEVLDREKRQLTSYAYAGQFQQRPAPREGGMFKRHWFNIVPIAPGTAHRVRRWDLAASLPKAGTNPDWTVGLRMARSDGKFYVEDVKRFRDSAFKVRQAIKAAGEADQKLGYCPIFLPQDPGQAGKDQAQSLVGWLAPLPVYVRRETGTKEARANPFAAQCEAGNVFLVKGDWNEAFIEELCNFPIGHDDQVDAAAGAFIEVCGSSIPNIRLDAASFHRANPAKIG